MCFGSVFTSVIGISSIVLWFLVGVQEVAHLRTCRLVGDPVGMSPYGEVSFLAAGDGGVTGFV